MKKSVLFILLTLTGAVSAFGQATQNAPGDLYDDLKYYQKELENYIVLFNQNPDAFRSDLAMTQSSIGAIYRYRGDSKKAEEYYLKALENYNILFKQNPDAFRDYLVQNYHILAYLYAEKQDLSRALKAIDKAIELCPQKANLYDSKGEILLMMGDEAGAVKMWEKVLEIDPDFSIHFGESDLAQQLAERGLIQ